MYKLIKNFLGFDIGVITEKNGFIISIPFDFANTDYANFKKDLANGAELQDAQGKVIDGLAYLATLDKEQQ
jgi:hypothetical protein